MIINSNPKSFVDNNDIKVNYLIGNFNQISVNLTNLFEENKFVFEIGKLKKMNEFHYITFGNNSVINEFVHNHKQYGIDLNTVENKTHTLEIILNCINIELLQYIEPIILNYFVNWNN